MNDEQPLLLIENVNEYMVFQYNRECIPGVEYKIPLQEFMSLDELYWVFIDNGFVVYNTNIISSTYQTYKFTVTKGLINPKFAVFKMKIQVFPPVEDEDQNSNEISKKKFIEPYEEYKLSGITAYSHYPEIHCKIFYNCETNKFDTLITNKMNEKVFFNIHIFLLIE